MTTAVTKSELVDAIRSASDPEQFRELNWTGTFGQYLDVVLENPEVLRTAHQRLYDMILSYGSEEVVIQKENITRMFPNLAAVQFATRQYSAQGPATYAELFCHLREGENF